MIRHQLIFIVIIYCKTQNR